MCALARNRHGQYLDAIGSAAVESCVLAASTHPDAATGKYA
jgi:hypothetical protein